jgi:hypothetical protein
MPSKIKRYTMSTTSDSGRKHILHIEDTYAVHDSSDGHDKTLALRIIKTQNGDMLEPDKAQPEKGKFRAVMSGEMFTLPTLEIP